MYFNLLEEFYWILGGMSIIGFNSEENRKVRETQIPCPAVVFLHMCNPSPTTRWRSSQIRLGEFCWLLEVYFLTPLPRSLLGIIGALQTGAGLGKYPDPSKRGESQKSGGDHTESRWVTNYLH